MVAPDEPPWVPFEPAPLATFAGAGRYVLKRSNDDPSGWTISKDFGQYDPGDGTLVDVQVLKAVRFWPAGTGELENCMCVTTTAGELWQLRRHRLGARPSRPPTPSPYLRDELWISTGRNTVRKCTADPLLAASWDAEIVVGDQSQAITNLETLDNTLYIFKENGVFTINPDTSVNDKFPRFRQQPRPRNGVNAQPWLSRLWFGYGDGYY